MAHFHCDFIQIILLCKTVNQQIVLFLSNSVCLNRLFCVFFPSVLPILRMHFAYVYISCLSICEFIVSVIRNLIVVPDSSNVFSLRCKTLHCHFSKVHLGLAFSSYNQRQWQISPKLKNARRRRRKKPQVVSQLFFLIAVYRFVWLQYIVCITHFNTTERTTSQYIHKNYIQVDFFFVCTKKLLVCIFIESAIFDRHIINPVDDIDYSRSYPSYHMSSPCRNFFFASVNVILFSLLVSTSEYFITIKIG